MEFGLFSDEGCVERGFYSAKEAYAAIAARYSPEDGLHPFEICPDHPEQPRATCEDCAEESDAS